MNIPCATAGAIGSAALIVHTFGRGHYAPVPAAAEAALPPATRGLNDLCWLGIAVLLLAMVATAFAKAFLPMPHNAVWAMGLIAAGTSVVSVVAARRAGLAPWHFPHSYLLGAVALAVGTDLL